MAACETGAARYIHYCNGAEVKQVPGSPWPPFCIGSFPSFTIFYYVRFIIFQKGVSPFFKWWLTSRVVLLVTVGCCRYFFRSIDFSANGTLLVWGAAKNPNLFLKEDPIGMKTTGPQTIQLIINVITWKTWCTRYHFFPATFKTLVILGV